MKTIKDLASAVALAIVLVFLSGCAQMFTVPTEIVYQVTMPDGKVNFINYKSNKDHQDLSFKLNPDGSVEAATKSATTPEAAMAAALQVQSEVLKLIAAGKMAAGK